MKKLYLTLIAIVIGLSTQAQSISVESFQALPMDMTASSLEGKRIDQNGATAALIKIVTSQTGFAFDGGALGIVDSKQMVGEIWVWVPYGSRKITISHQQLGVLRDYRYPIEIQSEKTYEMVLVTGTVETVVKEEPVEVVLKAGLLTRGDIKDPFGNYIYYLDGERLTNDEYMNLINNCPESKYYYEKGCRQKKTGTILLISGGGVAIAGVTLLAISGTENAVIAGLLTTVSGGLTAIASIPFFASGQHKKENAYKIYNEYCAKPTASLSFGPATQGIGMGVYLNF